MDPSLPSIPSAVPGPRDPSVRPAAPVPPDVWIRGARPDDAPALSGLLGELGFPVSQDVLSRRLQAMLDASESILVATVAAGGDVPIGLATLHVTPVLHRPAPVGRLTALIVTERERGRGIGRALVAAAEKLLLARGCGLLEVTSHRRLAAAHAFYERLGYEITSVRFKKSLLPGH